MEDIDFKARLEQPSTSLFNALNPTAGCDGCLRLNDPNTGKLKTVSSPEFHCLWGKVEEPMSVLACFEIPWSWMVRKASVRIVDHLHKANWSHNFDLTQQNYAQNNWSSVTCFVDHRPFDRRVFWARLTNWSHDLDRSLFIDVTATEGAYVVTDATKCAKCRILKPTGVSKVLKSPAVRCGTGTPQNKTTATVSMDIPRNHLIKKLVGTAVSSGNQGSMEFGFDLSQLDSADVGRWMSGRTSIDVFPDRLACTFELTNWSHNNARDLTIDCHYEEAIYAAP